MLQLSTLFMCCCFFFFFFFTNLSNQEEAEQHQQLHPSDYAALLSIKTSLADLPGSTFFSSWDILSNKPCYTFAGVICSPSDEDRSSGNSFGRVSALTLGTGLADSPGLTGMFPSAISNLTALTELVIYPGHISGSIPTGIGSNLPRLRLFSISGTLVSGPIPTSLAALQDLHTLDLSHNRLQDQIPSELFSSSSQSLKVINLAGNGGLYGELPKNMSSSKLLHLDLRDNSFIGPLPSLLPSTLRYLSVAVNAMSGPIHSSLSDPPPDLTFLDLSSNAFSESIPPAIFSLPLLSSILLQHNNLSGRVTLPDNLDDEKEWEVVDLSYNKLSGQAPAGLANAASLYLNDNQMTGALPEEYASKVCAGSMTTFYAHRNYLTSFPSLQLPLPDAVSLCLSFNCMDPSPESNSGCPADAGSLSSRPADQCATG